MLLAPRFDPAMIARVIERERTRSFLGVPTMIEAVEKRGRDVSSIERIMARGALVAPELIRKAEAIFGSIIQIV